MGRLMRHKWIALILLAFTAIAVARDMGQMTKLEKVEPPLEFILDIDGQKFPLTADSPTKLTLAGKQVTANLTIKEDRLFSIEGLSFRYPRQHSLEVDPTMAQWTLDGNNSVILVQRTGPELKPQDLVTATAAELRTQFGRANVKQAKGAVTLGGKKYETTRLSFKIASNSINQDILGISTPKATFLVMIQDSPQDNGTPSEEAAKVLELLDKTFKLSN